MLSQIFSCFRFSPCGYINSQAYHVQQEEQAAMNIVRKMLAAEKPGQTLRISLEESVGARGWTESLAERVLAALEVALREGARMDVAMTEAVQKAVDAATEFAKDYRVYCTLIALGVLVILAPWVIEALGFAMKGPVEGTFAALWQARYAGCVPKGSLFSFFQRLRMVWRRYVMSTSLLVKL